MSCRTCGAEYKASQGFLIAILIALVVGIIGGGWWYYSQKQAEKEALIKTNIATYAGVLKGLSFSASDAERIATIRYSDDVKSNQRGFAELKGLVSSYKDQRELSNKVARSLLAQPLSGLQKIKRDTESKKYTGCLEASRLIYVSAMEISNEALLTFLSDGNRSEEMVTQLFTISLKQEQEATKTLSECESTLKN